MNKNEKIWTGNIFGMQVREMSFLDEIPAGCFQMNLIDSHPRLIRPSFSICCQCITTASKHLHHQHQQPVASHSSNQLQVICRALSNTLLQHSIWPQSTCTPHSSHYLPQPFSQPFSMHHHCAAFSQPFDSTWFQALFTWFILCYAL